MDAGRVLVVGVGFIVRTSAETVVRAYTSVLVARRERQTYDVVSRSRTYRTRNLQMQFARSSGSRGMGRKRGK
ncbi:hypothetical protein B0H14DRAFT_2940004 [Mycena olivaceomarginata]|nr:hypothetical protein B0H14DRAFT_2940004 [Mycena olivaceomarginata]